MPGEGPGVWDAIHFGEAASEQGRAEEGGPGRNRQQPGLGALGSSLTARGLGRHTGTPNQCRLCGPSLEILWAWGRAGGEGLASVFLESSPGTPRSMPTEIQ